MARMRFNRVQPIIALSLLALAGGCEADPIEPSAEVVALAAKPEKPPRPSEDTGELVLRRYYVEAVDWAQGLGLTKNSTVNDAVYAYFESLGQGPAPEGGWAGHFGCPDGLRECSAVTLEFTGGKVEGLQLSVVPVVGSCGNGSGIPCLLDTDLYNRRNATLRWGAVAPAIPWELLQPAIEVGADGASLLTLYWQGQRGMERMTDTGETEKIRGKMQPIYEWVWHGDRFPDLNFPDLEGGPDKFFFHPVFKIQDGRYYHPTYSDATLLEWCEREFGCLAEYQGELGEPGLEVEFEKVTEEGGLVELAVRAININEGADNSNPLSFGRVMLTHPKGDREMLDYDWRYRTSIRRDESGNAATWYRLENLDLGSCYTFDLVGLIVLEAEKLSFAEDNRLVWGGVSQQLQVGKCSGSSSG